MTTEQEQFISTFREEAYENLAELETALLELESNPTDSTLIDSAFRSLHTIKGSGAMFEFNDIVRLTHDIETVYDLVRDGKLSVTQELIALTLSAHDQIKNLLEDEIPDYVHKQCDDIIAAFKEMLPDSRSKGESPTKDPEPEEEQLNTFRVRFYPKEDIFMTGSNPILLLKELMELGEYSAVPHEVDLPELSDLDPEQCFVGWDIILSCKDSINTIKDVFIFVEDQADIKVELIETHADADVQTEEIKKIGEILVDRGEVTSEQLSDALDQQKPIGEVLESAGVVNRNQVNAALQEQKHIQDIKDKRKSVDVDRKSVV